MRLICLLLAVLTLTGCQTRTVSYMLDQNQHALTVLLNQDTFWSDEGTLRVVMSNLPECQRQHVLGPVWLDRLWIELREGEENTIVLLADEQAWQINTLDCSSREIRDVASVDGQPLGTIRFDRDQRLVLEPPA